MYANSRLDLVEICRWTVMFHASTVGTTTRSGRTCGDTVPVGPKNGRIPLAGIIGKAAVPEAGPQIVGSYPPEAGRHVPTKLKAIVLLSLVGDTRLWWARTGRFCVTVWPKFEPNTPMSKLRPYPMRTTVLGLTS